MKRVLFLPLLFLFTLPLWAQEQPDLISLVGMRLAELIERFGPPATVLAARGNELWQDDVIFQYDEMDFFIYRDRVWQVRVASAHGIRVGDPRQAVVLVLGDDVEDRGDYLVSPLTGRDWPLALRVNFNSAERVSAIFIYRPDY